MGGAAGVRTVDPCGNDCAVVPWRKLLAGGAGVAVLLVALAAGAGAWVCVAGADVERAASSTSPTPLAIPPLAEPTIEADGTKVFDLRFTAGRDRPGRRRAQRDLGPERHLPRARRCGPSGATTVRMDVTNGVDEATTLHWHGMHLPAAMDGGPHQLIEPGATWSPSWTIDQPAATLWYHPHLHGETAAHVYRGAAGMFLVDDPAAAPDLPAHLRRRRRPADRAGQVASTATAASTSGEPLFNTVGFLGDTIVVNGTTDPHLEVTTERVRFRVLNASNARVYDLGFPDGRTFRQVASDAGLLERPHETDRVQLSPGRAGRDRGRGRARRGGRAAQLRPAPRGARRSSASPGATTPSTSSSCGRPTTLAPSPACPTGWPRSTAPTPTRPCHAVVPADDRQHQRPPDGDGPGGRGRSRSTRRRSGR